jgi:ATP-dependent Clp protease ATP-binding subunit ClpA
MKEQHHSHSASGVGKTTIANSLTQRLANNRVPGRPVAGCKYVVIGLVP